MCESDKVAQLLEQGYGLKVKGMVKVRDAWKVHTLQGPKCFKKVDSEAGKIRFVSSAVDYILQNGFSQTVPFVRTLTGGCIIENAQEVWYLTDWIEGREASFSSLEDVFEASRTLALLHRSSIGFVPPENCKPRRAWGRLPEDWSKRWDCLEHYHNLALHHPDTPFNRLYISKYGHYLSRCSKALQTLQTADYTSLVLSAIKEGTFCHRDYTYHNLIIDQSGRLYVIDFDYCTQNVRAYDIGRFLRKVSKSFNWDLEATTKTLEAYHRENPLSQDELIFILAFLYFPQRFWRISSRYYSNSGAERSDRLLEQLGLETTHQQAEDQFLKQFSQKVSEGALFRR